MADGHSNDAQDAYGKSRAAESAEDINSLEQACSAEDSVLKFVTPFTMSLIGKIVFNVLFLPSLILCRVLRGSGF